MPFDVNGAKQAGYSDEEIANFLGKNNNFDSKGAIESGYSPQEIIQHLSKDSSESNQTKPETGFWQDVGSNFVQGVKSAADIAKGDFELLHTKSSPETQALGDKLFAGTEAPTDIAGLGSLIAQKVKSGEISGQDLSKAFLEKFGGSLPGKAAMAVGGVVPSFNLSGTAIQKYVNPKISEATGISPESLNVLELAGGAALGAKSAVKGIMENPIPEAPASLKAITNAATYPVRHPIDTVSTLAKGVSAPLKAVAKPVTRAILYSDNPITGEPGLKTAMESPDAIEGARLGKKFGIEFSAGEMTGNKTIQGIEDALANSAKYGGKFAEANQNKVNGLVSQYNKILDKISSSGSESGEIGDRLVSAYRSTTDSLIKARSEAAAKEFKAADQAAGGQAIIEPRNFINTLESFVKENSSPIATDAQKSAAGQASEILSRLRSKDFDVVSGTKVGNKNLSISDIQSGLAFFGEGAKSGKGIWKNLETASDRRFANAAKNALQADLDSAADSTNLKANGYAGQLLKQARDNYRNNSQKLADVEKSTLGKLVGNLEKDSEGNFVVSPENVTAKFSAMGPSGITSTLKFLDKNNPEVANQARRYVLESSLRKAIEGKGQRGEGTTKDFAKAEFVKNLPDNQKLNALLKDPNAANDVRDIAASMNRLIDWGAERKGSQTFGRFDFMNFVQGAKNAFIKSITSDNLALDLLNPTTRRKLANEARQFNAKQIAQSATKKAINTMKKVPPVGKKDAAAIIGISGANNQENP